METDLGEKRGERDMSLELVWRENSAKTSVRVSDSRIGQGDEWRLSGVQVLKKQT